MAEPGNLVFAAISDPTRREILRLLAARPSGVGAIAARFPVSRPAISKHLAALHRAGLVSSAAQGRQNIYRTEAAALDEIRRWLDSFWGDRLNTLKRIAEGDS